MQPARRIGIADAVVQVLGLAEQQRAQLFFDIAPSWETVDGRQHVARAILKAAAGKYGADFIDPTGDFCTQDSCAVAGSDGPYYSDSNHLSVTGATRLTHLYEPFLQPQGASLP